MLRVLLMQSVKKPFLKLPIVLEHQLDFAVAHCAELRRRERSDLHITTKNSAFSNVQSLAVFLKTPNTPSKTFMNCTIPSGTDVLLSFCRYSTISEVWSPTLTAAYKE